MSESLVSNNAPAHKGITVVDDVRAAKMDAFLSYDPEKYLSKYSGYTGFSLDKVLENSRVILDAKILEVDRSGRYITRRYDKTGLQKRLETAPIIEARPRRAVTLVEAFNMYYSGGNLKENLSWEGKAGANRNPFEGFTPLFMGPFYRQQYMHRMLEAKAKAFNAYTENPAAKRIVGIITQFTLSKGVTAIFKDPKAQKVWDQFASYNNIGTGGKGLTRAGTRLRTWSDMLSTDGELFFQFVDQGDNLKLKSLDSATILEVVTDPDDITDVYYYHQQYSTPYNMFSSSEVPGTRYVIRQIPAKDMLHVKINVFENEKRGRSDLYTIIGWLKRLKDLINANVIKAYFHACYTWDYEIDGNSAEVSAFAKANKNKVPVPGSAYVHNKGVTRSLISPAVTAGSAVDSDTMGLLNMIALGPGIPLAYIASSFAGSRGAALTETEPASKLFFDRQSLWDETLHEFANRLFDWAESKGIHIEDRSGEFSFPQINPMDKTALNNILTSLSTQQKWFTNERSANLIARELSISSYDYKEEKDRILQEAKENIDRDFEEKKHTSLAETKLQVWQTYFSRVGAREEERGGSSGGGYSSPSGASAEEHAAPQARGSGKEISGGMSDEHRANVQRGGF